MSDMTADRAQEAANRSFEIKQHEFGRGKREKRKKEATESDEVVDCEEVTKYLEARKNFHR